MEIPSVVIGNQAGSLRLEIARSRANLFWQRTEEESVDPAATLQSFATRLADIFEESDAPVGRLAAVIHRSADENEPAKQLARQYFKDRWVAGPLNRPQQLEIHAHKVISLNGFQANSWMRIRTGVRVGPNSPVVAVEQDLNTLDEIRPEQSFARGQIEDFFSVAAREFDHILDLYFPVDVS
ncbi:MAG: hypothetical protein M3Q03_19815 [Chloroflexota bacterium]|nr:hypothetical protein [Chloroflexota bacterium]